MLPTIELLHFCLFCASSFFSPIFFLSATTHSLHVFLPLPFFIPPITSTLLHLETQSLASLRSTCPNHLNLPRLTTLSTPSIPNPCLSYSLVLLSLRFTPDIHLTILFSVLTSLLHIIYLHRPSFTAIHKHPLSTRSIYLFLHSQGGSHRCQQHFQIRE